VKVPATFRRRLGDKSTVPFKLGDRRHNFTHLWCGCQGRDVQDDSLQKMNVMEYKEVYRLCSERLAHSIYWSNESVSVEILTRKSAFIKDGATMT